MNFLNCFEGFRTAFARIHWNLNNVLITKKGRGVFCYAPRLLIPMHNCIGNWIGYEIGMGWIYLWVTCMSDSSSSWCVVNSICSCIHISDIFFSLFIMHSVPFLRFVPPVQHWCSKKCAFMTHHSPLLPRALLLV